MAFADYLNELKVFELFDGLKVFTPLIRTIVIVVIFYTIFTYILSFARKNLLKVAKTKKQISNVEIFSKIFHYMVFLLLIIFAIFSYVGSWSGLGLAVGLFSASLGFALQKPITGIAAWIMVITKRPFEIGDRVIIGNVKGDVVTITLTHIHIREIGGLAGGEERSGRLILVPNSTLFEQNIINYTSKTEHVMDQVIAAVTYESNVDKAIKIVIQAAKKHTDQFFNETNENPYVRTYFQPNGINVHVRYFVPAKKVQYFSSLITKEIYDRFKKQKDIEFAYPHTEIIYKKK